MDTIFVEPFQAEFMRTGALAAALVGIASAAIGCFVVIRGMALMADALAHGVLPGIAVAFLATAKSGEQPNQVAITGGALASGVLTAGLTAFVMRKTRFRAETATAVVFVFMLALGVALISSVRGYAVDLTSFLFGNVLGVTSGELLFTAIATACVALAIVVLYRPLFLMSFDRQRAKAAGVPVSALELALLLLIAIAVVIGFRVVGAMLVLGMIFAPPAASALLTKRLPTMMLASAATAALCSPVGLLISWHADIAAGSAIALVSVGWFFCVLAARALPRMRPA